MTQVEFQGYLSKILTARYGEEVRGSIHDALKGMNEIVQGNVLDVTTAKNTIDTAAANANQAAADAKTATNRANDAAAIIETLNLGDINVGEIATKRYLGEKLDQCGAQILRSSGIFYTYFKDAGFWYDGKWDEASSSNGTMEAEIISDSEKLGLPSGIHSAWKISTNSSDFIHACQRRVPIQCKTNYTMSCYAKGKGPFWLQFILSKSLQSGNKKFTDLSETEWKRYSYTFKIDNELENDGVQVYFGTNEAGSVVEICGMKLEKGTVATEWCPSYYDFGLGQKIGGRNLIKGTATPTTITANSSQNFKSAVYEITTQPLDPNTRYTVSFDFEKLAGDFKAITILISGGEHSESSLSICNYPVSKAKEHIGLTLAGFSIGIDGDNKAPHKLLIYAGLSGSTANNSIKISNLKFEYGCIETGWTPAPEDLTMPSMISNVSDVESIPQENLEKLALALKPYLT